MSTVTKKERRARAKAAKPGTVAADRRVDVYDAPSTSYSYLNETKNPEHVDLTDVFTEEELATMPLVIRMTSRPNRPSVWRTADGTWWRTGGVVQLKTDPADGVRKYVITLFKGATQNDLEFLKIAVDHARSGKPGRRAWRLVDADWADEKTYSLVFRSYRYGDPYKGLDTSLRVLICDEDRCPEKWHIKYGHHVLDSTVKELRDGAVKYEISVRKDLKDRDDRGWYVDVYTNEFYGHPDDVASFVNDLQWMEAECRRANEPAAVIGTLNVPGVLSVSDQGEATA